MRALEFDRLMALLLCRSVAITRPSLSCIEDKTNLFTMLGAPEGHIQYSGNRFSLGTATRSGVSDSKL